MEQALKVKNLTKHKGDFCLNNISFELPKGYIMGYVGQNGAGKTTTIKLITNMFKPDQGEIYIDGLSYQEDKIAYKESIGLISDSCYLPNNFNAKMLEDTLEDFYKTFDKAKYQELLERWDIPKKKQVKDFSKGMRIKLMFAGVLSRNTKILILDEATSGLDPVVRLDVLELLQEYIADGEHSILFSTHIMDDLEQIADYIFFIDKGTQILNASKDEILERFFIVKGGLEDLSSRLEEKLIGMTKTNVGFEGLLRKEDAVFAEKNMLLEHPSIDKIVIYHIQKMRRK